MSDGKLYYLASFSRGGDGGNPAGVWVGNELPAPEEMQQIAADVGASETAFVAPASGPRRTARYYSPEIEVSFCGHATIATGVVLGQENGEGTYILDTLVGEIEVTAQSQVGQVEASLRSVETKQEPIPDDALQEALHCLRWTFDDLDRSLPAVKAWAGAWHYVIAVREKQLLDSLDYDFDRLKAFMEKEGLTTFQLVWRERDDLFHSRNPFPIGGILEDPATGAAAAALGGYLRDASLIDAPFSFVIRQGDVIGMPSVINVEVPQQGGIVVSGTARVM